MVPWLLSRAKELQELGHELSLGRLHKICDRYRHFCTIVPLGTERSGERVRPHDWTDSLGLTDFNAGHHKMTNYVDGIARTSHSDLSPSTPPLAVDLALQG